jgi:hypothetical protein
MAKDPGKKRRRGEDEEPEPPPPDPFTQIEGTFEQRISELAMESEALNSILSKDGMTLTERRIELIRDMMDAGAWLQRASERMLAAKWNLSRSRIAEIAADANRLIRHDLREDPEAKAVAKAKAIGNFQRFVFLAEHYLRMTNDPRFLKEARESTHRYAQYVGVAPAEKLEVSQDADPFADWTLEEQEHYAQTGELPPRKAPGRAMVATAKVPKSADS